MAYLGFEEVRRCHTIACGKPLGPTEYAPYKMQDLERWCPDHMCQARCKPQIGPAFTKGPHRGLCFSCAVEESDEKYDQKMGGGKRSAWQAFDGPDSEQARTPALGREPGPMLMPAGSAGPEFNPAFPPGSVEFDLVGFPGQGRPLMPLRPRLPQTQGAEAATELHVATPSVEPSPASGQDQHVDKKARLAFSFVSAHFPESEYDHDHDHNRNHNHDNEPLPSILPAFPTLLATSSQAGIENHGGPGSCLSLPVRTRPAADGPPARPSSPYPGAIRAETGTRMGVRRASPSRRGLGRIWEEEE